MRSRSSTGPPPGERRACLRQATPPRTATEGSSLRRSGRNCRAAAVAVLAGVVACGALALTAGAAAAAAPLKSAQFDVVTLTQGQGAQITINSKVWVKGDKVRVEMKHPFMGQMNLIADGKHIYQIDPVQKQATRTDQMRATGGREPWQMFVANVEQLREKARRIGSETIDGHVCDIYTRREGERGHSASVKAWITRTLKPPMPLKVVRQVTLERPNASLSQTVTVRLRNLKLNPSLPDSLFKLPAGMKIVEGDPMLPNGAGLPGTGIPGGVVPRGSR